MATRVLFFEGPPGGGKSSLSELAARDLRAAGVDARWVEEHDLGDAHLAPFDAALGSNPDGAVPALLACWRGLLDTPGALCLDGAFFHSTLKLLLAYDRPRAEVEGYLAALYDTLAPAAPPLVHLTGDVERIVRAAIAERGERWAAIVAGGVAQYPCQRRRGLAGVDAMVGFFVESQRRLDEVAARYPFAYRRVDTTARDWPRHRAEVCALLGVPPAADPAPPDVDAAEYAGAYHPPAFFPPEFSPPLEVEAAPGGLRLHAAFVRNLRLVAKGGDRFAIAGRSAEVEFVRGPDGAVEALVYPFVADRRFLCERRPAEAGPCQDSPD